MKSCLYSSSYKKKKKWVCDGQPQKDEIKKDDAGVEYLFVL